MSHNAELSLISCGTVGWCWYYLNVLNRRFSISRLTVKEVIADYECVSLFLCFGFQVRHRWCELVVKHSYTQAYGDVEHFLVHDQVNTHFYLINYFCTIQWNLQKNKPIDCICVLCVSGHGGVSVWGADGSGGSWSAGSGTSVPLTGPGRNGPISTQSGGGDGPMTLEVKSHF